MWQTPVKLLPDKLMVLSSLLHDLVPADLTKLKLGHSCHISRESGHIAESAAHKPLLTTMTGSGRLLAALPILNSISLLFDTSCLAAWHLKLEVTGLRYMTLHTCNEGLAQSSWRYLMTALMPDLSLGWGTKVRACIMTFTLLKQSGDRLVQSGVMCPGHDLSTPLFLQIEDCPSRTEQR